MARQKHLLYILVLVAATATQGFAKAGDVGTDYGQRSIVTALQSLGNGGQNELIAARNLSEFSPYSSRPQEEQSTFLRSSDGLIHAPSLQIEVNFHSFLQVVSFYRSPLFSFSNDPPRQYALLRILFRAIISPNAP